MPELGGGVLQKKRPSSWLDLVAKCREENFGIWPTLSSPVQVRIGILNQLNQEAIADIAGRFADAMLKMGASFNKEEVMQELAEYFSSRI